MAISIKKEDNGKYAVRVWAKDKYGRRVSKFKRNILSKSVAMQFATSFEKELINPTSQNITFAELQELYIQHKKGKISETSLDRIKFMSGEINDFLGKVQIKRIDTMLVQKFIDKLGSRRVKFNPDKTISKGTQERYFSQIRAVLNFAVKYNLLDYLRVKKVEYKIDKTFKAVILKPEQIATLLSEIKSHYYDIYIPILLAVTTGARRGEVMALETNKLNFKENFVVYDKNMVIVEGNVFIKDTMKTDSSERIEAMSNFLKEELLQHLKLFSTPPRFICASPYTNSLIYPTSLSRAFKRVTMDILGINMRLHDLRHNFSQLGYEAEVDNTTRSKLLGHSNTKTTNNFYTQASFARELDAVNKVSNLIKSKL